MKEHDWIVAGLNNPNFTPDNFRGIGMYLDNTQLLSKEDYLKSDYIKNHDAFKDSYGNFSQNKFETFYNNKVQEFENFKTVDDVIYYDLYDVNRMGDPKGEVKDPSFIMYRVSNPNQITIGVGGINKKEESPFSARELAQQQNIFNSETGNFENYTPNDMSFTEDPIKWLKNLYQDPLVLATYDQDTIDYDPISGEQILYKKGQNKLNDQGQYYYETLNGRSTHGKEVLSSFDILTTDGVGLNKYDFFDSDGLDKNITGVIAKSAAAVAPLLIGGPVGSIYAGVMVARELIKVLPMIDGIIGGITGNDEDSLLSKTLYDLAAYGHKFSTSQSDYGKGLLTFEGLSNLLIDVALQYGQQQFIAKSWRKLNSFDKIQDRAEESAKALYLQQRGPTMQTLQTQGLDELSINNIVGSVDNWKNSALGVSILKDQLTNVESYAQTINRIGADLSLAYMALISNGDVYEQMLSYGTTKREAISVALGSTLGMFGVDRKLGLDTLFYDEMTTPKIKAIRSGLKQKAKDWGAEFVDLKNNLNNLNLTVPEKIKYYIKFGREKAANVISNYADDLQYHTTNFYGKAIGEGLEEMSEEFVSDISKQLYELASVFGIDTTTDNVNAFENVWDDSSKWGTLLTKYGSQFLGGFMGGGLFYGVEVFKHGKFKRDDSQDELIYLVRNNRTKDVLRHLDSMHKKGKLGSTALSSDFVITDGEKHFLTSDKTRESQNDFIYKRLREEILSIDAIIRENSLNMSEESLYTQMTFDEQRFKLLAQELKDISYQTGYQERYHDLVVKIVENDLAIKRVQNQTPDSVDNTETLEKLYKKKEDLLKQLKEFNSGETAIDYLGQMTFLMDARLNNPFFNASFPQWLSDKKHIEDYSKLNDAELEAFRSEYLEAVKANYKRDAKLAWEGFKELRKEISPELMDIEEEMKQFRTWMESSYKIFDKNSGPFGNMREFDYNSLLDGETEDSDSYKYRNKQMEDETDEDYVYRIIQRQQQVTQLQKQERTRVFEEVKRLIDEAGGTLDAVSKRRILINLPDKKSEILKEIIQEQHFDQLDNVSTNALKNIKSQLSDLKDDLSNVLTIQDNIYKIIKEDIKSQVDQDAQNRFSALRNYRGKLGAINDNALNEIAEKLLNDIKTKLDNSGIDASKSSDEKKDVIRNVINSIVTKDNKKTFTASDVETFVSLLHDFAFDELNDSSIITELKNSLVNRNNFDLLKYQLSEDKERYNLINGFLYRAYDMDFLSKLNLVRGNIDNDETYQFIKYIEQLPVQKNPITDVIKKLALKTNKDYANIESLLNKIEERLLSDGTESFNDFQLTSQEEDALTEAEILLKQAYAFLYASYNSEDFENPFGHNILMNNMAERNDVKNWEKLPVISDDVANLYLTQIQNYLFEIGQPEGESFTQGSWRWKSQLNAANVARKFLEADNKFAEVKLMFFTTNRNIFKSVDETIDLLKGYESLQLGLDPQINVYHIENLLYKNVRELLANGHTLTDLFTKTGISQLFVGDKKDIIQQKTCLLNENITYSKLTAFDKFMYILGSICTSAQDAQRISKKFIETNGKYAPLLTQEHDVRLALALVQTEKGGEDSLQLYKQGMSWLYSKLPNPPSGSLNPQLMSNMITLLGNGGAGKTDVCIRMIMQTVDPEDVWVSGPKDSHVSNLAKITGSSNKFNKEELFTHLLGKTLWEEISLEQAKLQAAKPGDKVNIKSDLFKKIKLLVGNTTYVLNVDKASTKIPTLSNPPKLLIIDEGTHYSNYEWSLLQYLADKYKFGIIAVGDEYQNGYSNGYQENLDQDSIFCGRTNRLYLTLRPGNIQKYRNTLALSQWLYRAYNADPATNAMSKQTIAKIIDDFSKIQLDYYNGSTINGDFVTEKITDEVLDKLSGSICFIGDKNSEAYRNLCAKFGQDKIFIFEEDDVQGSQFDFVIIDKNWKSLWNNYINELNRVGSVNRYKLLYDVTLIAKSLYTLSTRGKTAAIFIDNGLSKFVKFNKDSTKANVNILNQSIIDQFKQNKLNFLLKLNLDDDIEIDRSITENQPSEDTESPAHSHSESPEDDDNKDKDEDENEEGEGEEGNEGDESEEGEGDENEGGEEEGNEGQTQEEVPLVLVTYLSELNLKNLNHVDYKYFLLKVETNLKDAYNNPPSNISTLTQIDENTSVEDIQILLAGNNGIIYEIPNKLYETQGSNSRINKQNTYKCIINFSVATPPNINLNISYTEEDENLKNSNSAENDNVLIQQAESIKSTAVRSYAESHLSGFRRTKSSNNKYIWETDMDSNILKDCVNFLSKEELETYQEIGDITVSDGKIQFNNGQIKAELVRRLILAKSFLMYEEGTFNELQNYLGDDLHEWKNNLIYKIIVEPKQDSDNFVGYSGLDEEQMAIKGEYTYKLVAEWKSSDNKTRRITLSLLANPEKLTSTAQDSIRDGIQKRMQAIISQLGDEASNSKLYIELQRQLDELPTLKETYNDDLEKLKNEAISNNGTFELIVPIEDLNIQQNSAIRNITSSGNTVRGRRLSELHYRPRKNFDPDDSITSWEVANPYVVMSEVYGYRTDTAATNSQIYEGGAELGGKAVIFASRNLGLSPEQLLHTWIREQGTDKHSVRMLLLDSVGVDFRQLVSNELQKSETLQTTDKSGRINYFPFETKYMAYRQLIALWNFRANLQQFIQSVKRSLSSNLWIKDGITEDNIDELLRILGESWVLYAEGKDPNSLREQDFREFVKNSQHITDQVKSQLKLIFNFNDSLSTRIRQFRLGRSSNKDFIIRKLTAIDQNNPLYKDIRNPKGIYLTYEYANKLNQQISLLLDTFLSPVYGPDFKFKTNNGSPIEPNVRIDANANGTLSYLLPHISNLEEFSIELPNGTEIKMPQPGDIRYLPSMLVELYKSASAYQHVKDNDDEGDWDWDNLLKKFTYSTKSSEEKILFGNNGQEKNSVQQLIESGYELTNLLNLSMFGTVEDFIDKKINNEFVMQATDAYFKYGFLSDPQFNQEKGTAIYNDRGIARGSFVPMASNKALFKLTGALDFGYIYIDLHTAYLKHITNNNSNIEDKSNPEVVLEADIKQKEQALIQRLKGEPDIVDLNDNEKETLISIINSVLGLEDQNKLSSDKNLTVRMFNGTLQVTYERNKYDFQLTDETLLQIVKEDGDSDIDIKTVKERLKQIFVPYEDDLGDTYQFAMDYISDMQDSNEIINIKTILRKRLKGEIKNKILATIEQDEILKCVQK